MGLLSTLKNIFFKETTYSPKSVGTKPRNTSLKKCYFCGKTNQLVNYTDGKQAVKVCPLCAEYAHRRAYKRI